MSRPLRVIPEGGALVEVTTRTLQSRFLLRPSRATNEVVLGVLGRAQRLYPVEICGFVFASNHYHLLLRVADAEQLANFMGYSNSNLARELGRLVGWREKVWSRRYTAIVISDEEAAQRARLKYVLAHGAKEDLVDRPRDWPGVHAVRALLEDEPLAGLWFDRTAEYAARQRGEEHDRLRYATPETVVLSPLPCWNHLSPETQRDRVAAVVREIEEETAARREAAGITPLGRLAVLQQDPHDRPNQTKKSPMPLIHAATRRVRKAFRDAYRAFVAAYREAPERLKVGMLPVAFPVGSFPPALPFVGG